jgi:hypothetical protein
MTVDQRHFLGTIVEAPSKGIAGGSLKPKTVSLKRQPQTASQTALHSAICSNKPIQLSNRLNVPLLVKFEAS